MLTHHSYLQLVEVIPHYLVGRGWVNMTDVFCMYPNIQKAAGAKDRVRWRHFMEGKFVRKPLGTQKSYLLLANTRLTVDSWARGLAEEIMSLTHSQWIYHNVRKHHTTRGLTQQEAERQLDAEIECHRGIGLGLLPPESH